MAAIDRDLLRQRFAEQAAKGATTMRPTADAAEVAAELARRFGLPTWQLAMTATDANRFALHTAAFPEAVAPVVTART